MNDPITIELLNPTAQAFAGEPLPLHLVIRCPAGGKETVLRTIRSMKADVAQLDADLFERDTPIGPGEVYRCIVVARFPKPGYFPDPLFVVVAGLDTAGSLVRVPTPPVRVVPSLSGELRASAESICTYDNGTKVDVTIAHRGATPFDNLRLTIGPLEVVRAGVSDQRRLSFLAGQEIKFTTVVAAGMLTLELDADVGGQRVGPVSLPLPIPKVRDEETVTPFRFLEPKKLTQAEVCLFTLDEERAPIRPAIGVFPVRGGGEKYRVDIKPAHPHAQGVKLRGSSGVVEVSEMPTDAGVWSFQMVVVNTPLFTSPAALHFDVLTPDGSQQGEINLSVRPQSMKLWIVAATAGAAVTVKGATSIIPAILAPNDSFENIQEALLRVGNIWDFLQFISIPVIRVALWVADCLIRPFQDD